MRLASREYYEVMCERYKLRIDGRYIHTRGGMPRGHFVRNGHECEAWIDGYVAARQEMGDYGTT